MDDGTTNLHLPSSVGMEALVFYPRLDVLPRLMFHSVISVFVQNAFDDIYPFHMQSLSCNNEVIIIIAK